MPNNDVDNQSNNSEQPIIPDSSIEQLLTSISSQIANLKSDIQTNAENLSEAIQDMREERQGIEAKLDTKVSYDNFLDEMSKTKDFIAQEATMSRESIQNVSAKIDKDIVANLELLYSDHRAVVDSINEKYDSCIQSLISIKEAVAKQIVELGTSTDAYLQSVIGFKNSAEATVDITTALGEAAINLEGVLSMINTKVDDLQKGLVTLGELSAAINASIDRHNKVVDYTEVAENVGNALKSVKDVFFQPKIKNL